MPRNAKRRFWTAVELKLLTDNYADSRTADIATALGRKINQVYSKARKLGLAKSAAYLAGPDACRLRRGDEVGARNRFPKGHVPANKGLRRPGWSAGGMSATWFPKGHRPHTWMPVGSYRISADGYLELKLTDLPGAYNLRWTPVHRLLWVQANGPIPEGHVVAFKAGRRTTELALITLDALELISRRELMARNTVHNLPKPLARVVQLRGELNRQINKRTSTP